jgi:hypothetical protein
VVAVYKYTGKQDAVAAYNAFLENSTEIKLYESDVTAFTSLMEGIFDEPAHNVYQMLMNTEFVKIK